MGGNNLVFLLLLVAIPVLVDLHLFVAPYTKVEESFHIQAIHDILKYGIPTENISKVLAQYDHSEFPGAVPRTFVGAVLLSGLSQPFIWLNENIDRQTCARAILGLFNALSLVSFGLGVRRAFGKTTAIWYLLFQASQFHVLYYASRTLSNMFAFGMSTLAIRALLPEPVPADVYRRRCRVALFLLTIAGIVFRSELALFLDTNTAFLFATGRIRIVQDILPAGALGLAVGLVITVLVDSFFWQQLPLWPELAAFRFNVLAGQASAWGTHPWHFYFTSAIPRLLLNPLTYLVAIPCALLHPSTRSRAAYMLVPSLAFVAIYSIVPHKEWRFIVYIVPSLTAVSAQGASYLWTHRTKSILCRLLSLALLLSTLASFLLSTFVLLPASSANYPGARALNTLHNRAHNSHPVISVYLGNLACQTGVTRFLEMPPPPSPLSHTQHPLESTPSLWHYDKTEDETAKSLPSFWDQFDYLLVEPAEASYVQALPGQSDRWAETEVVNGFAGVKVLRPGDVATGQLEERVLGVALGPDGARSWREFRDYARKYLTRGWWAELRMEPKIRIMQRV
ncbi:dolichyl-P-Man:Man(7)GlcNAc(2)-PP-dolichol alpha-1,6-mannosyltransferase [Aspergillus clavatus NRRL 1]|uniref:Mannosyltransferase n=1 Tax=Aspergillus clavatus (strain ATCC 1007 / CBS 513.65 / DSM 816 / NCTC 3887 / NRRL 1 / QM 1276 / 107) TaxID=344612 RepID=A1CIK9_ASPCL|nr:alpha-1,6-mannosyltransferase subunit (Ecm39), putative [Aspergillus clavatus NRRL 1]EAW10714.1 alpha-1,6-mannosyltransferase subunit (Ecm39), putative [Aspergillus clavatus NRRL 1]